MKKDGSIMPSEILLLKPYVRKEHLPGLWQRRHRLIQHTGSWRKQVFMGNYKAY